MAVLAVLVAAIQALVLIGALIYARRQVAEAKSTREATIRPFMVIDFDVDRPPVINLSIGNIGPVMATNVRFAFDPPLASSFDERGGPGVAALQMFADGFEHFPPGKTIKMKFDYAPGRWNPDAASTPRPGYPDRYVVTVTYKSDLETDKREFTAPMTLDLGLYRHVRLAPESDLRDLSKHVKQLADSAAKWTSTFPTGLVVITNEELQRMRADRSAALEDNDRPSESTDESAGAI
jgi:hypothetical protein